MSNPAPSKETYNVGLISHRNSTRFDSEKAKECLKEALDLIKKKNPGKEIIVYIELLESELKRFAADLSHGCVLSNFSRRNRELDELEQMKRMLEEVDCIVRIGGDKQDIILTEMIKASGRPAYEYELAPHVKVSYRIIDTSPNVFSKTRSFTGETLEECDTKAVDWFDEVTNPEDTVWIGSKLNLERVQVEEVTTLIATKQRTQDVEITIVADQPQPT